MLRFHYHVPAGLDFQKINTLTELHQQLKEKRENDKAELILQLSGTRFSATKGLPPGPRLPGAAPTLRPAPSCLWDTVKKTIANAGKAAL